MLLGSVKNEEKLKKTVIKSKATTEENFRKRQRKEEKEI